MITNKCTKKKTVYHHGNLKKALIETALTMLEKKGLKALTLYEISKELGVSRSAIYRHFENKEVMIKALREEGFKQFNEIFDKDVESHSEIFSKRFYQIKKKYIDFALSRPKLYQLMYDHSSQKDINEIVEKAPLFIFDKILELIVEAQNRGIIKKEDSMLQAITLWAWIRGMVSLLIDKRLTNDKFKAICIGDDDALLKGLKI